MSEAVGIIAGGGRLPVCVAQAAREKGHRVAIAAFRNFAEVELAKYAHALTWVHVGELGALLEAFRTAGVRRAVLAGQVPKLHLYGDLGALKFDEHALVLLRRLADRRDHSILAALADWLAEHGIELLRQGELVPELLAPIGCFGAVAADARVRGDLAFGWPLAKQLAQLQVGQTVVVKDCSVIAVEALEGTDATLCRGAELAGPGVVAIKVAKLGQDPRFDLPTVGLETVNVLAEAKAAALVVEAGSTLILERAEFVRRADACGLALLGVSAEGPAVSQEGAR